MTVVGAPDFAGVRRNFFARTVDSQTVHIANNTNQSFTYTDAQMGDCAMLRYLNDAGCFILVDLFGVSGDIAEEFVLAGSSQQLNAHRGALQPYGGGMTITVWNRSGLANKGAVFQLESYVGVQAHDMGPFNRWDSSGLVNVAASANLPQSLRFDDAHFYDRVAIWANCSTTGPQLVIRSITTGLFPDPGNSISTQDTAFAFNNQFGGGSNVFVDQGIAGPFLVDVIGAPAAAGNFLVQARVYKSR